MHRVVRLIVRLTDRHGSDVVVPGRNLRIICPNRLLIMYHCEKFWFRLVKVSKKVHGFVVLLENFYLPLVNVFKVLLTKKIT